MAVIEVQNLKKYFGRTKAVDGISFGVEEGEIFGFLGPNGAGKTTTIRCVMDFLRPDFGSIKILGRDSRRDSTGLKRQIGYLSGTPRLYDNWTSKEHIEFVRKANRVSYRARELIDRLGLDPYSKTRKLSSGNRQKLAIIMALMLDPKVLVLDEPTLALDPFLQNNVYEILLDEARRGKAVFMSSHNLTEVERICHRVGIIREGRMAAIESIASLKEKRMYSVYVAFYHHVPKEEFNFAGVQVTRETPRELWMNITGDLDPLLQKLSEYRIRDMYIGRSSLEEIFMEFYR